jgi:3-hydroxybutyryl-CoA dehydrogenase
MKNNRVLLLGDGNVAADLAGELQDRGLTVDCFVHDGPIRNGQAELYEYLNAQYASLNMAAYDAVLLAFTSDRDVQRRIVQDLEGNVSDDMLFLVSAMSLSATEIASWFEVSERVIGFGYVPPLSGVKCLEAAKPLQGKDVHAMRAAAFLQEGLEREVAFVKDSAGLVMPRIVSCIVNEAVTALAEGVATVEDLDTAMKLGVNYPHGPLEWADQIGLDQVYATLLGVYEEQGEDRYRPAPLLRRMVLAKQLGIRTGEGFYNYEWDEGVENDA